jgi:hypothetical protein
MSESIYAGPWAGGLTEQGFVVKGAVFAGVTSVRLLVDKSSALSSPTAFPGTVSWTDPSGDYRNRIVTVPVTGLEPRTVYHYVLELNGARQDDRVGMIRTLGRPGEKHDLRFGIGSCSGNDGFFNFGFPHTEAFDALADECAGAGLDFFAHLGDLHYGNIKSDEDLTKRIERYEWFLEMVHHGRLFRNTSVSYCWDDHDFLGNNRSGGDSKYRTAARSALDAYDIFVPHHPFVNSAFGITQAFSAGRVRFLHTDQRFNKTSEGQRTILGMLQKQWLLQELSRAAEFDLVVWASSFPWISPPDSTSDHWGAYEHERREIANAIRDLGVRNLCMVSGDAHMLAIDDGSNNRFSSDGRGGFPVFHAAALDSNPSQKGGTYSIGQENGAAGAGIAGKRQYGIVEVTYDRDAAGRPTGTPRVTWIGRRAGKKGTDQPRIRDVIRHEFAAARSFDDF